MSTTPLVEAEWLRKLSQSQSQAAELLAPSAEEQQQLGYFHTFREICQQPSTWMQTCDLMCGLGPTLRGKLTDICSIVLTGSGSSEYAGDCVRLPLQDELGIVTSAIGGGALLAHGSSVLPTGRPVLMVSLARSGDSPESAGALALMLKTQPDIRHLVLTCNESGNLAKTYRSSPRVTVITLGEETNDRGLVMTSSFTNLVLAARILGMVGQPARYRTLCEQLSRMATNLI